jgi:taurine dioxygenase
MTGLDLMETAPLSPRIGTEVRGVDCSVPADDAVRSHLRNLFADRHLLYFPDQDLSHEAQVRTVSMFGPILPGGPEWVSNVREHGQVPDGRLLFHSDFMFTAEPSLGIALYAVEIPEDGCPTVFASAVGAAELLSDELRAQVAGRRALNIFDLSGQEGERRFHESDLGPESPVAPRYAHPVLMVHRVSGQELVSVNEMQTDYILDMDPESSEELLARLRAVLYATPNTYCHRWRRGDLVIWDNIALQHGRPQPPSGGERTLRRTTMAEHDVFDLVPGFADVYRRRRSARVDSLRASGPDRLHPAT